jgi:hypothetical protein
MRASISRRGIRARSVLAAAFLIGGLSATPARAQFSFFGPSEVSPQDIYDTVAEHGFRLIGPLYRNGRVYLADVIDRRQRRERLVIAAENGQIVQRFLVDIGGGAGPRGPVPQVAPPRDDSFFSHLTRGWDDEPPPRPPLGLDNGGDRVQVPAPTAPAAAPRRREPRVVTRTEGTVPPPGSVTSSPLPVPAPQPAKPDAGKKPDATASAPANAPDQTGTPAPADTPPASGRGTTVSTDPLRIPGNRQPDAAKPTSAASVASKAPTPAPAAPATPPKPAAPARSNDVPVAPLD